MDGTGDRPNIRGVHDASASRHGVPALGHAPIRHSADAGIPNSGATPRFRVRSIGDNRGNTDHNIDVRNVRRDRDR